ncbi:MAG: carboxypeptidase-like regulatory domain-containing protein [Gemmatimonadota bacterium]
MIALLPLLLTLALGSPVPPASDGALVWGRVTSASNGKPLRYAVVEVVRPAFADLRVETDSAGYYELPDVPPGRRTLRASHIDHAPYEIDIDIPERGTVVLNPVLDLRPVRLPPVTGGRQPSLHNGRDTLAAGRPALGPATTRALESTPGVSELGMAEAARDIPGQEPLDPSDILYVRGGAADLKLVLLDGAPVYAPFHMGGLIPPFEGDVLRSAALYLGGAPARYDGGLSYVMDMETRSGRTQAPHAVVAADLLSVRTVLEGPVGGRAGYLASVRHVHGAGADPFLHGAFPYGYSDLLVRGDVAVGQGLLRAMAFWNREEVQLDSLSVLDQVAAWGNRAGSLRYHGVLGATDALVTVAGGVFESELPIGGVRPLETRGEARRLRVTADFERLVDAGRVQFGASFDRSVFRYGARARLPTDSLFFSVDESGDVAGIYADATIQPHPRLRLRGGLRGDVFSLHPALRVAPRFGLTYALSDRASISLAGGRYRQYVRAPDEAILFLGSPLPDTVAPPLAVASANHVVLSLDQTLGEGMRLGVEGFYKRFKDLPSVTSREAQSSGVDLWAQRVTGSYTGWVSYSLAWVWSVNDGSFRDEQLFSGRHLVSAGAGGPILGAGEFEVRLAYGAGMPYTAIPEPEVVTPVFGAGGSSMAAAMVPSVPATPDEPFLRVDLSFARSWRAVVNGFAFEVKPYVRVLNALNRRDALFYHFERGSTGDPRALAAIPLLPVAGVEWSF